jgi:penicillin G amidase
LWKAWIKDIAPQLEKTAAYDGRFEYAAWQAMIDKPAHLLPKPFTSWDQFLSAQADWVRNDLITQHGNINDATWGARNKAAIKHPFTRLIPALSPYLDMPATPQSGDGNMPSVATPTFGASQRLSVTPGREENGILTMPGGQSGHPLSPFYGAGHKAWAKQESLPLQTGATKYTLTLRKE